MEKYIIREADTICRERLSHELIIGIVGARQVGKTTLLLKLKELLSGQGIFQEKRIIYFSLDDLETRTGLKNDFRFLEKEVQKITGEPLNKVLEPVLLIIDEVQKSDEIFNWLKLYMTSIRVT